MSVPVIIPNSVSVVSKDQVKADLKQTVKRMIMDGISVGINSSEGNNPRWNQAAIANYLRNNGLDYSLSVFLAESGTSLDKLQQIRTDGDKNNLQGNKVLFQVWEKLEDKYNTLLKQRINEIEEEVANQVRTVESILRRKIIEEENSLKKLYGRKLDDLEMKEREMENSFERRKQNVEDEMENERKELLRQIREVEFRRKELCKVENQLGKQIENEMKNLSHMREELTNFESSIRRRELEINLNLDQRTRKIRNEEQIKYKEKLREFINREENLKKLIDHAKSSHDQHESLQFLLKEKEDKIRTLEESFERQKHENAKLIQQLLLSNEKLKEISDSRQDFTLQENVKLQKDIEKLNEKLLIVNAEFKQLQRESQNEIKQLQFELAAANSMITEDEFEMRNNLHKKLDDLRNQLQDQNEEWKGKLNEQKLRYDELKKHWQFENERTKFLSQEVNKLRKKNLKDDILKKPSTKRLVRKDYDGSDDETSRDSPPDFVKDAQARLQQLEQEAKDFDSMLNKYRMKEMNTSAKLLKNSTSLKYINYFNNNHLEIREDGQQLIDSSKVINNRFVPLLEAQLKESIKDAENETKVLEQPKAEIAYHNLPQEVIPARVEDRVPLAAIVVEEPKEKKGEEINDWESRLKAREEERRRRDEEFMKAQQDELSRIDKESKPETVTAIEPAKPVDPVAAAPAVDPMMQKYMDMVLEQKRQQLMQNQEPKSADAKLPLTRAEPRDDDIDVASIERPSSSEFEW